MKIQHGQRVGARGRLILMTLVAVLAAAAFATPALANHPVFVEGNCNGTDAEAGQRTVVTPGACGDYDGDGRVGTAEDGDGLDRVFGTLGAALGPTGAAGNGMVTIVTSGIFAETVRLSGNITLQGAPGVEAVIEAVLQGGANNNARQAAPGIVVDSPANRHVVIRNVTSRNWTDGILVAGRSRVSIDNVRIENNTNYGIEINDDAIVSIHNSVIHATGFRLNPMTGDFPTSAIPNPGKGIEFADRSTGMVVNSVVTASFSAGISDLADNRRKVCIARTDVWDNGRNFEGGPFRVADFCGGQPRTK